MKIEKSKYQGYLWFSNAKEPHVINNEDLEIEKSEAENPFIIEGQLFDGKKSISIKYVDGKYIYKTYMLAELKDEFQEQLFFAHRMGDKQLKFRQYWREVPDDCCEGMEVLQPAELVFVGFKNKEE